MKKIYYYLLIIQQLFFPLFILVGGIKRLKTLQAIQIIYFRKMNKV